ncbi:MAG: 1-acyl-sn-glycerol-3-phosphate acyltransferase, partial [Muribaculaceae bacterium]|nr:1-acyl-sn-glycerol-3-phosphate acyltransferase [Muribaculaceae bacterium]
MKYLFFIYQWFIAAPILLVLSFITAFLTIVGSLLFSKRWWGYYPPKIWSRCWCILFFVRVEVRNRELIDKNKHYIFVANHEGAFDIFSIYGYLNHNFRW